VAEPQPGGEPSAEQVRREVEAVLLRVVTVGRVAEVLWRLLHTEEQLRRAGAAEASAGQDSALMRRARQNARDSIAATVHEDRPEAYHAAVSAACRGGDPDLAAVVLAELARLHLRAGYPDDCHRLLKLAEANLQQLCEQTRQALARTRAMIAVPADPRSDACDVPAGHDEPGLPPDVRPRGR
jgi:hypothetical protein